MKQRVYISIFLALAILLAGCIGGGSSKTQIVSRDMLVIKSIDIFPSKTLQPDDSIIIRMEVENAGQADAYLLVDADGGKTDATEFDADYLLIDHCKTLYPITKTQVLSGGKCEAIYDEADKKHEYPLIPLVKDSAGTPIKSGCYMKIAPQGSHTFQWTLKAPPENEIAKMTQKCAFKFQTAYAAQAITSTYVYFADPLEIAQRLYTKKEMSLAGDNVASYGPVAVNFVPAEPQPVPAKKSESGEPETWTVFLNLRNVGTGIADVNDIALDTGDIQKADAGLMKSGCRMIGDIEKDLELVKAMINSPHKKADGTSEKDKDGNIIKMGELYKFSSALGNFKGCDIKVPPCTQSLKKLAGDYYTLCQEPSNVDMCNKKNGEVLSALKNELDSAKRQLQIYSQQSSRIPCELTMPDGVAILTPFRFTTAADYTYKIRQDIDITTKPIRETA